MSKQYIIRTATKPRRYYYRDAEGSWQTSAKLAKADRFAIRAAHEAYRTIVPVLLPEDPMDAQLATITFQATRLEVAEVPPAKAPSVELRKGCKVVYKGATNDHGSRLLVTHLNNRGKRATYPYDDSMHSGSVEGYAVAAAEFLGTYDLIACGIWEGGYVFLARNRPE
jgi:hypothetical protein